MDFDPRRGAAIGQGKGAHFGQHFVGIKVFIAHPLARQNDQFGVEYLHHVGQADRQIPARPAKDGARRVVAGLRLTI